MDAASTNYELHILKTAVNNHLDRTLPSDANQALSLIQYQIDNLVWSIATSIYRQSGYKVNFSLVRDLADFRIESLKILAIQQAEAEARRKAEEEARRIEQARLKAEEEARRKAQKEKVKEIVAECLEVEIENIKMETCIFDLCSDKLDNMELMFALEEEFDIEIYDEVAKQMDTVGKIVEFINKETGSYW